MAKGKARSKLPDSAFAYPKQRKYPIDTPRRARAALSRAGDASNFGSYPTVAKAVRKRYGDKIASVGPTKGTVSKPGYRKTGRRK